MTTVLIGTLIFVGLFVVASIIISIYVSSQTEEEEFKPVHRSMAVGLTFLAVLCMYIMWVSVFMHQKYPLITPEIEKEVLEIMKSKRNSL